MGESNNPLRVEYGEEIHGLRVARQASPPGAASFSATYVGPAGWGFDPPGRGGVSRVVNQVVTSAAGRFNRIELARRLDRAGATLSRQCAPESGEVTIWGPAADWQALMGLLADVVLRPRFDPSDIARARRQLRERQLRETTQPANRAERELLKSIYPRGHPYRESGLGDGRSLTRFGRADLVRFHEEHYTSGGAVLVVTGPARLEAVQRVARRLFGRFREQKGPALRVPNGAAPREREHTVNLPGRSQVEVRLGGPSIARSAPEYPAAYLANEVLGGRPILSRLFQRVREKGGLAYHASSEIEAMRYGGHWVAQAGTGADRWRKVVRMLREEVNRMATSLVPPAVLDETRESAIGQIPLALESTAEAHELAVEVAYHSLPPDYWLGWPTVLRGLTPRDVRRAAELALDGRTAVTVLAGPLG
jgi:zinc protease